MKGLHTKNKYPPSREEIFNPLKDIYTRVTKETIQTLHSLITSCINPFNKIPFPFSNKRMKKQQSDKFSMNSTELIIQQKQVRKKVQHHKSALKYGPNAMRKVITFGDEIACELHLLFLSFLKYSKFTSEEFIGGLTQKFILLPQLHSLILGNIKFMCTFQAITIWLQKRSIVKEVCPLL